MAIDNIKMSQCKLAAGSCMLASAKIEQAKPGTLANIFHSIIRDPVKIKELIVRAKLLGKEIRHPGLRDFHVILPQSAGLMVWDGIVAARIEEWTQRHFPLTDGCYAGGGCGAQIADRSHSIVHALFKGCGQCGGGVCRSSCRNITTASIGV